MSSFYCGATCACKVVDRATTLRDEDIVVMRTIQGVMECGSGSVETRAHAAQAALERLKKSLKCPQPRWAHLLSLPVWTKTCQSYTLLYGCSRSVHMQWLVPSLLDQASCLSPAVPMAAAQSAGQGYQKMSCSVSAPTQGPYDTLSGKHERNKCCVSALCTHTP
jgi:hypothetical protein